MHYQAPADVQGPAAPVIDPALDGLAYIPPPQRILGTSITPNVPATADDPVASLAPDAPVAVAAVVAAADASDKENAKAALKIPGRAPKASGFGSIKLEDAVHKARSSIKPTSVKRRTGIEDAFTQMSRFVIFSYLSYHWIERILVRHLTSPKVDTGKRLNTSAANLILKNAP